MAFPQVAATSKNTTAGAATHAITMPSGIVAGHLLLIFFATDGDNTVTDWDGFTQIYSGSNGTASSFHIGWKIAEGSDTCTLTVSVTNEPGSHICYRITGHDSGQAPEAGTAHIEATQYPDPPSFTPTGGAKDFLWIAAEAHDATDTTDAYPTNFDSNQVAQPTGDGNSGCGLAVATDEVNASVLDIGSFTLSGTEQILSLAVAVHPVSISQVTLAGVSNGTSTATASKKKIASFGGLAQGVASVVGVLILTAALIGGAIGGSTASGAVRAIKELVGSSGGTSTVTGDVLRNRGFSGQSDGTSTTTASLTAEKSFVGTSDGAATASGVIQKTGQFAGASTGQSTASAALQAIKSLNGQSGHIGGDLLEEGFEGDGYENPSWIELIDGTIVDEDFKGVTRPPGGGQHVLKMAGAGDYNDCFTYNAADSPVDSPISYTSFWFRLASLHDGDKVTVAWVDDGALYSWRIDAENIGGTYKLYLAVHYDGILNQDIHNETISLDTWYLIEVLYDVTNGLYEFRLDGTALKSDSGLSNMTDGADVIFFACKLGGADFECTYYVDLLKISSTGYPRAAGYATGTLSSLKAFSGQSDGASTASSALTVEGEVSLAGVSAGSSTADAELEAIKSLAGQSGGQSTASAALQATKTLNEVGRKLACDAGVYAITGIAADLTYSGGVTAIYGDGWHMFQLMSQN